jgi:hypothetical protein
MNPTKNSLPIRVVDSGGLVSDEYNSIEFVYNEVGELEKTIYRKGTKLVATLVYTYEGDNIVKIAKI